MNPEMLTAMLADLKAILQEPDAEEYHIIAGVKAWMRSLETVLKHSTPKTVANGAKP